MACSVPHTYDEIKAMVEKQIEEDKARQLAIMNLAVEYDNACGAKNDLRKAYEECNHIPQESRALIDTFLKEGSYKECIICTEKELHQLHLDEEALREILEEKAIDEKAREEKIKQKQADDEEFFLEFGVVRYDSDYESSD
ncbi:hypothetical protein Tco_0414027 [Tanacetum coccineum]